MEAGQVLTVADIEKYLGSAEAGRLLGLGPSRIKALAYEGHLDYIKTTLGMLIEPNSIERLIEKRRQKALRNSEATS